MIRLLPFYEPGTSLAWRIRVLLRIVRCQEFNDVPPWCLEPKTIANDHRQRIRHNSAKAQCHTGQLVDAQYQ